MKRRMLILLVVFAFFSVGAGEVKKNSPAAKLNLGYVSWDNFMLGADSPEKLAAIRKSVKRSPVIGLVSMSGIKKNTFKDNIEYVYGPENSRGMHDTYQIYEVRQIAAGFGVTVKVRVYHALNFKQIAEAFRRAGRECDIVITYYSYWHDTKPMLEAVAANPETLYISPYVEVGKNRTNRSFQSGARHPDGSGLKNFVTVIPLSRRPPAGKLLIPSHRDKNDTETVNFVAPSSYASSAGETCPSAGVAAVAAAYIVSTSDKKIPAEQIIEIMLRNTSVPKERMLKLRDFNEESVKRLQDSLDKLTAKDVLGIRRLESDGVLDIWKIYQEIAGKNAKK